MQLRVGKCHPRKTPHQVFAIKTRTDSKFRHSPLTDVLIVFTLSAPKCSLLSLEVLASHVNTPAHLDGSDWPTPCSAPLWLDRTLAGHVEEAYKAGPEWSSPHCSTSSEDIDHGSLLFGLWSDFHPKRQPERSQKAAMPCSSSARTEAVRSRFPWTLPMHVLHCVVCQSRGAAQSRARDAPVQSTQLQLLWQNLCQKR